MNASAMYDTVETVIDKDTRYFPCVNVKGKSVVVPSKHLTIKHLHDKIPSALFQRSTLISSMYLLRDVVQSAVTIFIFNCIVVPLLSELDSNHLLISAVVQCVAWNVYWFAQGLNWTGLWVLAHECGHQAFSPDRSINNAVGFVLHSFLLVPYHSWRITHGNHHKNTNHLYKDTVFVPAISESVRSTMEEESPLARLIGMIVMFTLGWPFYLAANATGQKYSRRANHFEPASPLFRHDERNDIVLSSMGIVAALSVMALSVFSFGWTPFILHYFMPYLWVNFWLVFITYMQHTDVRVPRYDHKEWTFVRGALGAVDRDFGWLLNAWLHHINDSHVVHHIFSQMPFYHAIRATNEHIAPLLGPAYLCDRRGLLASLVESWSECRYVVASEGTAVFRK